MTITAQTPISLTREQGILDFYNAFSTCDFEKMHLMMHPECTLEFPGSSFPIRISGRDNIIDLFRNIQAAMGMVVGF